MRIGMAQLLVEGGEAERNLERAQELILSASENHCDLILLPETLDLGWTHPSCLTEADPIPGPRSDQICQIANDMDIFICCGLTELDDGKVYNSAILVNNRGEIILRYRKVNLLDIEQPFYEVGQSLGVVQTEIGVLGLNICSDNYEDSLVLGHSLARMGAQIILSPSSWTVDFTTNEKIDPYQDKWIGPYRHLASLYDVVVVGVTSVGYIVGGPYEGRKSIGCSLAVGKNSILAEGTFNEISSELILFDCELPKTRPKGTEIGKMLANKGSRYYGL